MRGAVGARQQVIASRWHIPLPVPNPLICCRVNRSVCRLPHKSSERETRRMNQMHLLRSSDQVHGDVLLYVNGRYLEAPYNLEVSLAQFGRLCCLFLSHSRVVHCDFVER
ncbi:hypothetical protein PputUW4_03412 [Pseudomonas sp. UW4]|nr:hypothetical protein PputUW4_03412 [Pseudomonas sp. UW4]